jgi:hypothetical protein
MEYKKARPVSLKTHPIFNEKWLQQRIFEDPTLLGLGDLTVKDVERRQPRAGRLDLLMSDPETGTRYEVEIQLGATDETHIIRTIEYWDIEKARYPQYEHVAVIVAEDITSRFLNVINLFNKAIPLVAVQMRALEVDGALTVHATTVLDLMPRGTEEEDEPGQATDRVYWQGRSTPNMMTLTDHLLALVHEVVPGVALKYNKFYIGIAREGVADNFVSFRPRKDAVIMEFRIPLSEETTAAIEASGLDRMAYDKRWNRYRLRLTQDDLTTHKPVLRDLVHRANGSPALVER